MRNSELEYLVTSNELQDISYQSNPPEETIHPRIEIRKDGPYVVCMKKKTSLVAFLTRLANSEPSLRVAGYRETNGKKVQTSISFNKKDRVSISTRLQTILNQIRAGEFDVSITTKWPESEAAESTEPVPIIDAPATPMESARNEQFEQPLDGDIDSASKVKYPLEDTQQRAIKTRRGQPDFRKRIFAAYDNKCSVTGCAVHSVLEAGHIIPHAEGTDWDISNGLPLRADIHTLFDLRLLAVGPGYLIHISSTLSGSDYEKLHGRMINLPRNELDYPSPEKLAKHFEGFEERNSDE